MLVTRVRFLVCAPRIILQYRQVSCCGMIRALPKIPRWECVVKHTIARTIDESHTTRRDTSVAYRRLAALVSTRPPGGNTIHRSVDALTLTQARPHANNGNPDGGTVIDVGARLGAIAPARLRCGSRRLRRYSAAPAALDNPLRSRSCRRHWVNKTCPDL